jgi:hypothetical protein
MRVYSRPIEITSKRPVTRKRQVVEVPKIVSIAYAIDGVTGMKADE